MTARRAALAALVVAYLALAAAALYHVIPNWVVALLTGVLTVPAIIVLRRRARQLERASARARQRPSENGG